MKFFTIAALMLVSTQAIVIRDEDDEPQTAAQAAGMRDGDMFSDQVDNFMEQAHQSIKDSKDAKRQAAIERVKAQSPTHSVHVMEQPTEKKASIEEQATTMPEIHTIEY